VIVTEEVEMKESAPEYVQVTSADPESVMPPEMLSAEAPARVTFLPEPVGLLIVRLKHAAVAVMVTV
jgi:hypothetical protein